MNKLCGNTFYEKGYVGECFQDFEREIKKPIFFRKYRSDSF